MRKLTTIVSTLSAVITLAACQPAAKEEAAVSETTEAPAVTEAAPDAEVPAAADAAKEGEAADAPADTTAEPDAAGSEHTGGIKVGQ